MIIQGYDKFGNMAELKLLDHLEMDEKYNLNTLILQRISISLNRGASCNLYYGHFKVHRFLSFSKELGILILWFELKDQYFDIIAEPEEEVMTYLMLKKESIEQLSRVIELPGCPVSFNEDVYNRYGVMDRLREELK